MNITCTKCKVEKPEEEFHNDKSNKTGRYPECKLCRNEKARWKEAIKRKIPIYYTTKLCSLCSRCLPIDHYNIKKDKSLPGACRECENKKAREVYKEKNKRETFIRCLVISSTHKLCPTCDQCLPNSKFSTTKSNYLVSSCKSCVISNNKQNHQRLAKVKKSNTPPPTYKTHHLCPKCGKCLPISSYYLKPSGYLYTPCKECQAKIGKEYREENPEARKASMEKWLEDNREYKLEKDRQYYHEHKEVILAKGKIRRENDIDRYRQRDRDYYQDHKEERKIYDKKYALENRDARNIYYKEYNEEHKDKRNEQNRKWRSSLAKFLPMGPKLLLEDLATNIDDKLHVRCKNCKKPFRPTNSQCADRIKVSKVLNGGDGNFYCSDKCKAECDIFGRLKVPKSLQPAKDKSRTIQKGIKKELLKAQCKEDGYNYCERCGDILDVDIHHTWPLSDFSIGVDNPDIMVLLCPGCHVALHGSC